MARILESEEVAVIHNKAWPELFNASGRTTPLAARLFDQATSMRICTPL